MAPAHAAAFRALNLAWISHHFAVEPKDLDALDDPQRAILDKGGAVLMVLDDAGEPIGCAALLALPDGGVELAKMTTVDAARGTGVGRALIAAAIARARAMGAPRVYLETNSSLAPALALYRSSGFVDLPKRETPYARADVFMELRL